MKFLSFQKLSRAKGLKLLIAHSPDTKIADTLLNFTLLVIISFLILAALYQCLHIFSSLLLMYVIL